MERTSFFDQVYRLIKKIPSGRVATYGQIARMLGNPSWARTVGHALHALPEGSGVPWQRVINAKGQISLSHHQFGYQIQKSLLQQEGVLFDQDDRIDLIRFGWKNGSF